MKLTTKPFTLHHSPLTVPYPLTVIHDPWLMVNGAAGGGV